MKRIYGNLEADSLGFYCVYLCVQGVWEEIFLDDYFPCSNNDKSFFSCCKSDNIWVQLAEKAFAKISGGYANLTSGYTYEALYTLTGAPTASYILSSISAEEVYTIIRDGFEFLFPMATSTLSKIKVGKQKLDLQGLVAGHAYSMLGIVELSLVIDGLYTLAE